MAKWFKITGQGKKNAEIDIIGEIGGGFFEEGVTKEQIKADLKEITALKAKKITVNISSLGGSVDHALAIHDFLKLHEAEVTTIITGMTASAATLIAQAADEGKRFMSANALHLVHNASGVAVGNAEDMKTAAKDLKKVNTRMAVLYSKRGGQKLSEVRDLMALENNRGEWQDAETARDNGFVDEVIEPTAMAALAKKGKLTKAKLPKVPKALRKVVAKKVKAPKAKKDNFFTSTLKSLDKKFDKLIAKLTPSKSKSKSKSKAKITVKLDKKTKAKIKKMNKIVSKMKASNKATKSGNRKKIKALEKKLAKAKGGSMKLKNLNDPNVGGKGKVKGIGAEIVGQLNRRQKALLKNNTSNRD